ncbi:TPA: hypothetical protein SH437_004679, partial [Salmonella enterica]|nr:hypothetical protein [Salmonella enterica]
LASVLFYVMLAHWVVSDMNHPELMTYQQGFPLHLMIIGLFFIVTGLYVCRQTWSGNRWRKIA